MVQPGVYAIIILVHQANCECLQNSKSNRIKFESKTTLCLISYSQSQPKSTTEFTQIFQPKRVRKNQNAALKNDVQVKSFDDPQFVDPDNPICTAGMCDFGFSTLQVFQQVGPQ